MWDRIGRRGKNCLSGGEGLLSPGVGMMKIQPASGDRVHALMYGAPKDHGPAPGEILRRLGLGPWLRNRQSESGRRPSSRWRRSSTPCRIRIVSSTVSDSNESRPGTRKTAPAAICLTGENNHATDDNGFGPAGLNGWEPGIPMGLNMTFHYKILCSS